MAVVDLEHYRGTGLRLGSCEPVLDLSDLRAPKYGPHTIKHPQIGLNGKRYSLYDVKAGFDTGFTFSEGVKGYRDNGFSRLSNDEKVKKLEIYTEWNTARFDLVARSLGISLADMQGRWRVYKLGPIGAVSAEAAAMAKCWWGDRSNFDYDSEEGDVAIYSKMILNNLQCATPGEVKTETTLSFDERPDSPKIWLNHVQSMYGRELSTGRSLIYLLGHPFTGTRGDRPEDLDLSGFQPIYASFRPTIEQVRFYRIASGDINPAHDDPEYMKRTQFGKIIVYGQQATGWCVLRGLDHLEPEDRGKELDSVDVTFRKPVFTDETDLTPYLKPPTAENPRYQILALDQNMRSVIDLKFGVK